MPIKLTAEKWRVQKYAKVVHGLESNSYKSKIINTLEIIYVHFYKTDHYKIKAQSPIFLFKIQLCNFKLSMYSTRKAFSQKDR